MKKLTLTAAIFLVAALLTTIPANSYEGCRECYLVDVPDPDGGPPIREWACLSLAGSSWLNCYDSGLVAWLAGGCHTEDHCWSTGYFPEI